MIVISSQITMTPLADGASIRDLGEGRTVAVLGDAYAALRAHVLAYRDRELGRWRSEKYPDYSVYPILPTENVNVVDERRGMRSVVRPEDTTGTSFIPYLVAAEYYATRPPLPTKPGIYVPSSNTGRLGQTNTYRLDEDGRWHSPSYPVAPANAAEVGARSANLRLGGLVRLVPEAAK